MIVQRTTPKNPTDPGRVVQKGESGGGETLKKKRVERKPR